MTDQGAKADPERSPAAIAKMVAEARGRLAELAPALEEARKLRLVLELLGPEPTHVPARKARILAIVDEEPGITVAELAARHGMKRTVVASSVSRLKRAGEIAQRRGGLRVPEDPPGQP